MAKPRFGIGASPLPVVRSLVRHFRRIMGIKPLPELDDRLSGMERVFQAPKLTRELVAAIKLISPHCDLKPCEKHRVSWEADQNGACWGEYEALAPLFQSMPRPAKILEIGPGLGRSIVFFSKMVGWEASEIHAFEGDGDTTKYTLLGPRYEDSFCGNRKMLQYVLDHNSIRNVTIFDAAKVKLADLPGPYDFLYSFYSVGFHWSLEHYLDDLLPLLANHSVAVFTVPQDFAPFDRLTDYPHRTLDWQTAWPKDGRLKLLVLGKQALPN